MVYQCRNTFIYFSYIYLFSSFAYMYLFNIKIKSYSGYKYIIT